MSAIPLRLLLVLVLLTTGFAGGAATTRNHYRTVIAGAKLDAEKAVNLQLAAQAVEAADRELKLQKARQQNDENEKTIRRARAALATSELRIHIPSGCPVPEGGAPSPDTDKAGGVLSNRVDEAFARLQKGVGELVLEADELNIRAVESNDSR